MYHRATHNPIETSYLGIKTTMHKSYASFSSMEKQRLLEKKERECITARWLLAILAFLGFMNNYALRVNLSVGIVAMTNYTDPNDDHCNANECPEYQSSNTTNKHEGEFEWNAKTQGLVLGSFFYGYVVSQLPGGWLASRIGGKPLFGLGIFFTGVLTLLTPLAARYSVYLFVAVRILEGLCEGVTYPSMHAMWGRWAPKSERSRLTTFTYAGSQMGSVLTWPIAGLLCDSDFLGGWPSVFYVFGTIAIIWSIFWMCLAHNTPADHPRISPAERDYIESSVGTKENLPTPWKSILTSPAVISICVSQFCSHWMFYVLLTTMPTYLKTIHKFDIKSNGFLSALPYLAVFFSMPLAGFLADAIRSRGYLSTLNTRRTLNTIGMLVPAALLILCGYIGCNRVVVVVLLTIAVGMYGFVYAGFFINHLDIAPRFAGVLMGLANAIGSIPGFAAPAVVGYLTNDEQTMEQWRKIFFINACVVLFGCIIFNIFAQGEEQPWARPPVLSDSEKHRKKRNEKVDNWLVDSSDLVSQD